MAKKKKRSGGGGGGGCGQGQPPKPAEECEDDKAAAGGDQQAADDDEAPCEKKAAEDRSKDKGKEDNKQQQGKKALPVVTAVLKVDMHCDGCAKRIRASVRHYPGVEGVAMHVDKGTMTVVGRLDAKKLRDRVANKTRKKVDLVVNQNKGKDDDDGDASCKQKQGQQGGFKVHEYGKPDYMYDFYWLDKAYSGTKPPVDIKAMHDYYAKQDKDKPTKEDNKASGGGGGGGCGGGGGGKANKEDNKGSGGNKDKAKEDNSKGEGKDKDDKACGDKGKGGKDNKKPTVPVVGTVVLKVGAMGLHCDGCMKRVRCKLFKIKGVEQVTMDLAKNLVTVTGTMDIKALPGTLQKKLRRPVDVAPANKDKDKDKQDANKQQGCNKDGKEKEKENKGDNKQQDGGCKDKDAKALTAEMLMWKTAFYDQHSLLNTEFMLSDENPNACRVM